MSVPPDLLKLAVEHARRGQMPDPRTQAAIAQAAGLPAPPPVSSAPGPQQALDPSKIAASQSGFQMPQLRPGTRLPPAQVEGQIMRTLMAMPGAAQVRPPQLGGLPNAAEVSQAANAIGGGDPRQQAAEAMQQGNYTQPDFLARPPGEDQMEDFAFRSMVRLGEYAPAALQQSWLGIQEAKRQRLAQRADYHATLIKQRHGSDLELRNMSIKDYGANRRLAAENLMRLRLTQADMEFKANQQNVDAANKLRGDQREAVLAFAKASAKAAPTPKERQKIREKDLPAVSASWASIKQAQNLLRATIQSSDYMGGGIIGRTRQYIGEKLGFKDSSEFRIAWAQMRSTIVRNFASEAGARAVDATVEQKALADTMPDAGDPPEVMQRWLREWHEASKNAIETRLNDINEAFPGAGDRMLKDLMGDESTETVRSGTVGVIGEFLQ